MSRHRFVRNLDLDAERDDGALSDGADEEMTPEQTAQMEDAFERVRTVLGDEATSGLSDRIVKDTLWEVYFNVDEAIDWLVQEQDKQKQARERKGHAPPGADSEYGVPATRGPGPLIHQSQQHIGLDPDMDEDDGSYIPEEGSEHTRLSTITEHTELTETSVSRRYVPGRGFTAYRRRDSQQTSPGTPAAQAALQLPPRESIASTVSSFGQVIRHYDSRDEDLTSDSQSFADALSNTDPNQIEPSPPPSALGPSEITALPGADEYDDAGSDRTASPPPNQAQLMSPEPVPVPPPVHAQIPLYARTRAVEVDIFAPRADSPARSLAQSHGSYRTDTPPRNAPQSSRSHSSSPSKSSATSTAQGRSLSPPVNKPLPSLPPPSPSSPFPPSATTSRTPTQSLAAPTTSKRTSKLSALASSRASTITKSSRLSGGSVGTESVLTFPALRPSRESMMPPSVASVVNIPPPSPSAHLLAQVAEEEAERGVKAPAPATSGTVTPKSGSGSGSASLSSGARRRGETEAQAIARLARARASHSGESLGLSPEHSSHGASTPPGITVQSATATSSEAGDQVETRSFDSALFRTGRPAPPPVADDDVSLIGSSFEGHGPVPGQGQVYGGDARERVLSDATRESGMSSIVRRAIQSALELEAVDKQKAKAKEDEAGNMAGVGALMGGKAPALPEVQRESEIEPAPTPPPPPVAVASPPRVPPTSPPRVPPTSPPRMSKLQARAHARAAPVPQNANQGRTPSMAESVDIFAPPASRSPAVSQPSPMAPSSSETLITEPTPTESKGSKLAALAAKRAALARKTTTRYLPPGTSTSVLSPTVTTAITTSYHTRDTMGPLPALGMNVVSEEEREKVERERKEKKRRSSVSKDGTTTTKDGKEKEKEVKKESKLAEKARAARRRKEEAEAEENKPAYDPLSAPGPESWAAHLPVPTPAIFVPQLRDAAIAAQPSGFAATLTTADGHSRRRSSSTGARDADREKARAERRERRRSASRDRDRERKEKKRSHSTSHAHREKDPERKHRRSRRESKGKEKERSPSSPPPPPPPSKFTFDTLSPDDVVLNARRGTALAGAPGFISPRASGVVGGEAGALGLMTGAAGGARDSIAGSERPASTAHSVRTGTSVGTGETWVTAPYAGTAGASLRSRIV